MPESRGGEKFSGDRNREREREGVLRPPAGTRDEAAPGSRAMSSEESYLAIIRYLTDEREPYAPGTHGNTKRKIRKAAACYVVRGGTLYYQRRLKGQKDFTELEVVLQDARRTDLIRQAHGGGGDGGDHLNQQLTWDCISQKYWWRGKGLVLVWVPPITPSKPKGERRNVK